MTAREAVKNPQSNLWTWIRTGLAVVVIPVLVWAVRVEIRLAKIESNRFTSGDGRDVWRALEKKADRSEVPPPEVREFMRRIEAKLGALDAKIDDHVDFHLGDRSN